MGFAKGHKKIGGRQAGTPNRRKAQIQERILYIIETNIETIQNDLEKMDPCERLRFIVALIPYVLPKQQSIAFNEEQQKAVEKQAILEALNECDEEIKDDILNRLIDKESLVIKDVF